MPIRGWAWLFLHLRNPRVITVSGCVSGCTWLAAWKNKASAPQLIRQRSQSPLPYSTTGQRDNFKVWIDTPADRHDDQKEVVQREAATAKCVSSALAFGEGENQEATRCCNGAVAGTGGNNTHS